MEWVNTETVGAERAMLVRFCARFTHDVDTAEDLVHQALLQAWHHENQLRDQAARSGWLLSIARNTCRMWLRQHRREQSRVSNLSQLSEPQQDVWLVDAFDIKVAFDRADRADLLRGIMARLPVDTRDLLLRKYEDERSQAEIATELGLTEGAVEARLHRARSALRRLLRNEARDEIVVDVLSPVDDAAGQEIEVAGSPAIVTGFESLADGTRFQAVMLCDTLRVLSVDGQPYQANTMPSEVV